MSLIPIDKNSRLAVLLVGMVFFGLLLASSGWADEVNL